MALKRVAHTIPLGALFKRLLLGFLLLLVLLFLQQQQQQQGS